MSSETGKGESTNKEVSVTDELKELQKELTTVNIN